jgi:hypothetical protein
MSNVLVSRNLSAAAYEEYPWLFTQKTERKDGNLETERLVNNILKVNKHREVC